MKLIVVGANGYIGRCLYRMAEQCFSVVAAARSPAGAEIEFCLGDKHSKLPIEANDVLVMCAAVSSPDLCESDYKNSYAINVTYTAELIDYALSRCAKVIFFSSDTVYGNFDGCLNEYSECNPIGAYASMKYEVEQRFRNEVNFKALRLSYVYSLEDGFTRYLLSCGEVGVSANVFSPFCRMVVWRNDVVAAVMALAKNWKQVSATIINIGGTELIDRPQFAEKIRAYCAPSLKYSVVNPPEDFFDKRPSSLYMESSHLSQLLGKPACRMDESLTIECGVG